MQNALLAAGLVVLGLLAVVVVWRTMMAGPPTPPRPKRTQQQARNDGLRAADGAGTREPAEIAALLTAEAARAQRGEVAPIEYSDWLRGFHYALYAQLATLRTQPPVDEAEFKLREERLQAAIERVNEAGRAEADNNKAKA